MSEKLFDLSVVLPIFNGGELFMDAIFSIENSMIPFKNVFISFNGSSDLDYQSFLKIQSQNHFKNSYTIFQTNLDLDAMSHGNIFLKKLELYLQPNNLILMLAHDDRIIPPDTNKFFSMLNHSDLNSTIFFPSYHCCLSSNYQEIIKVIEKDEKFSTEEFFFKSLQENISTNMSGMILPFHALLASNRAMNQASSRGARFEHITCISPGIKQIQFHKTLKMLIGERENSEGKLLSYKEHRIAAFNYVWFFLKNGQLKAVSKLPVYFYYLAKNWLGYLLHK
jgi:hypothetical protein